MGNQKEFIAQVEKLKKEFDFAFEMAILVNADRLKYLEEIEKLNRLLAKYNMALLDIARQKTCAETEADEDIPIGSDGSRLGDVNMGYDCIIEVARKALNIKSNDNGTTERNAGTHKG